MQCRDCLREFDAAEERKLRLRLTGSNGDVTRDFHFILDASRMRILLSLAPGSTPPRNSRVLWSPMTASMICPTCRHNNAADARFCSECGTSLPKRCPSCGESSPDSAKFCQSCGMRFESGLASAVKQAEDGDRRQLTVLFCDLVGSTELSTRVDPEDWAGVLRQYQQAAVHEIESMGGHIAQYLGDGLLAYFGYPAATEQDADRAVRAALGAVTAVASANTVVGGPGTLAVRIGVHTGLVVIGAMGSGARREVLAIGETANIAARLQGLAAPNEVLLSGATHRLVSRTFACEARGPQNLKGIATPVQTFRALHSRRDFEVVHSAQFCGRDPQLHALRNSWQNAQSGRGGLVVITGEAGIGKSRIIAQLRGEIDQSQHRWLETRASPYTQHTAYWCTLQWLEQWADLKMEDSPAAKAKKVAERASTVNGAIPEAASIVADLLGLGTPSAAPDQPNAELRRRKTLQSVVQLVSSDARTEPTVLVAEDLHWADASTLEIITALFAQCAEMKLLLICTCRPEFVPPWRTGPATTLTIERLSASEATALITGTEGAGKLPPAVVREIVAKTDGVPLFVEELTRTVVESIGTNDPAGKHSPLLRIPTTLQDSLMARLDRLGDAKQTAQLASTIGREFTSELLASIAEASVKSWQEDLRRLEAAQLVYRRESPAGPIYVFKHALLRDAAYESLLKRRRQALHRELGAVFRSRYPGTAPEILAHHFTEGGLVGDAIACLGRAAGNAVARCAFREAIAHFEKALRLCEQLPAGPEQFQALLPLQLGYAQALASARGFGASETREALERARSLSEHVPDQSVRLEIELGLWVANFACGNATAMEHLSAAALRDAAPGSVAAVQATSCRGITHWFGGRFAAARPLLEEGRRLAASQEDKEARIRFGQDVGVPPSSYLALVVWAMGEGQLSETMANEALSLARQLGHMQSIAFATFQKMAIDALRGDTTAVAAAAGAILALVEEHEFRTWAVYAMFLLGWSQWHQGAREAGLQSIQQSLAIWEAQGLHVFDPLRGLAAKIDAAHFGVDHALRNLDTLIRNVDVMGQKWFDAELHRIRGELLALQESNASAAIDEFTVAATIARGQGTRTFELRAALAAARLQETSDPAAAVVTLSAATAGWTSESGLPEIDEARRLSKRLSAQYAGDA